MKLKGEFIIREFNNTIYAVPADPDTYKQKKPIILNATARLLWEALSSDRTKEELTEILLGEYDVDKKEAQKDVAEFIDSLISAGIIIQ